jgi:hypothetical protein
MPKPKKPEVDDLDAALSESEDLDAAFTEDTSVDIPESPLNALEPGDDIQKDAEKELTEIQKAFRKDAKRFRDDFESMTDPEFWCAFVFQNREQKEAFLKALGLLTHGDKYLDGQFVARKLGITLPEASQKFYTARPSKHAAALPVIPVTQQKGGEQQ